MFSVNNMKRDVLFNDPFDGAAKNEKWRRLAQMRKTYFKSSASARRRSSSMKDSEVCFYGTRETYWSSFGKPNKLKEIIIFSEVRKKEYGYLHL